MGRVLHCDLQTDALWAGYLLCLLTLVRARSQTVLSKNALNERVDEINAKNASSMYDSWIFH